MKLQSRRGLPHLTAAGNEAVMPQLTPQLKHKSLIADANCVICACSSPDRDHVVYLLTLPALGSAFVRMMLNAVPVNIHLFAHVTSSCSSAALMFPVTQFLTWNLSSKPLRVSRHVSA
jgi:hypothetical protein